MWNTWFISLKYLDRDYPLDAFVLDIYAFSFVLMWGLGFLLEGSGLTIQLAQAWQENPRLVLIILAMGAIFGAGMRLGLGIISSVGLMLTVAVRSSITILMGTTISIQVGGLPPGGSPGLILAAAGLLLLAVLVGVRTSQERERNGAQLAVQLERVDRGVLVRSFISTILVMGYSYGLSAGMRSVSHPEGLAPVAYMALLSSGSLLGALVWGGGRLTYLRQWGAWRRAPSRYHWLAAACAVAHYGGNLLHAFGVPGIQYLLPVALWIVAVGSLVTLIQRVVTVRRESAEADAAAAGEGEGAAQSSGTAS